MKSRWFSWRPRALSAGCRWGLPAWTMVAVMALLGGCGSGWSATDGRAQPPEPIREIRGVWVATVANIDWPSRAGLDVDVQRDEMRGILDRARELKLNAIFLQVRPACDAIYPSALEPWSEYLTGAQGTAPGGTPENLDLDTGASYDPLAEWIAGAHERGIELHAWINPFRARHQASKSALADGHISQTQPGLVREYDGYLWLDPGEEAAVAHTLAVVDDIVSRYPVDGVHFDDYFYPYPKAGKEFPDEATYERYCTRARSRCEKVLEKHEWRRRNIDAFVSRLRDVVKFRRATALVSASPFGIWRPGNPAGVEGFDAYALLHADARAWARRGDVDAIFPQLYWRIGSEKQPFAALLEWWTNECRQSRGAREEIDWFNAAARRTLIAPGLIPSRVGEGEGSWETYEILNHVTHLRRVGADGCVLFSMKPLMENRKGLAEALREGPFAEWALMPWVGREGGGGNWKSSALSAPMARVERNKSGDEYVLDWSAFAAQTAASEASCRRGWVVSIRYGERWKTMVVEPGKTSMTIGANGSTGRLRRVALAQLDRERRLTQPTVFELPEQGSGE